jgi:thymidylate synthase (FAD)
MKVKLVWITPDAEKLIVTMARVSNPESQNPPELLLAFLIRHRHWSPFEMAHACVEIETTRDIGRQILRHRSFSFQEFSQRYANTGLLLARAAPRETRMQDPKNRQSSLPTNDSALQDWWSAVQRDVADAALAVYDQALERGIAKEQARAVLPEGLTPSRMYMVGSMRSWLHYFAVRTEAGTQKEHRDVALAIQDILRQEMPMTFAAMKKSS